MTSTETTSEPGGHRIRRLGLASPYAVAVVAAAFSVWVLSLLRTLALAARIAWAMGPIAIGIALGAAVPLAVLYVDRLGDRGRLSEDRIWSLIPLLLPVWMLFVRSPRPWRGPVLLSGSALLSALLLVGLRFRRIREVRWAGFVLAILLPFILYLFDISPYVGQADTFEFQVVAPTLGVAHPSGYPLYTLIGKFFSLIPIVTVAWRVNLSSAVFAALASGVLFIALTEHDGHNEVGALLPGFGALIASWALAFSPTLWSRAIEAEVYALNAFLVALALAVAVMWQRGTWPTSHAVPAFGLLTGVALASHVTLGALGLLGLVMLLTTGTRPRVRTLLIAGALGLLGVALYLYIPVRWPAVTGGDRMSLGHFWRFVTNAESGGALRPTAFIDDPGRWGLVGALIRRQVGIPGLVLAVAGLITLSLQSWNLALGMVLTFAAWIWFNLSFYVADPDYSAFLIPAHVILLFWFGIGVRVLIGKLVGRMLGLAVVGVALVAVIPMGQVWTTGPTLNTRAEGYADEMWARYALQQPLVEGSAILADSEKFPPLYYLQQVEGVRTDLDLVTLFNEDQYRAALDERLANGQTVYMARYLPGLDAHGVGAVGPLVQVAPELPPETASGPAMGRWEGTLALTSSRIEPDPLDRRMHHLHLTWRAEMDVDRDLAVRARLVDPETGMVIWTGEGRRPVGGYTNTRSWTQGTVVSDYLPLDWPVWIPPGAYRLDVGVFQRFGAGLARRQETGPWLGVGALEVSPASWRAPSSADLGELVAPSLPRGLYADEFWLSGIDLPGEAVAEGVAVLGTVWACEADDPSGEPWLRWIREDGEVVERVTLHPVGYTTPSAFCADPGARPVPVRYEVPVPGRAGSHRIEVGWGTGRTARCRWLGRLRDACAVGMVDVLASGEGLANYDDKILLLDAEVDAGDVPAGGPLHVRLRWRTLREMTKNYTVFVQVLGPDGKLYGQADSWPVQGARPTRGWEAGEALQDPYQLYVDTDGPGGEYRVIVGWYLLADMSRLPVLNAEGAEIGDHVVVGSFSLP